MAEGWLGGSNNRVPFGLKDGRLHFVTQVETGLACECVCPDPQCGLPLIARNRPSPDRKRAYHFMHASEARGCAGRESALHRMAKDMLLRASSLLLPPWAGGALEAPEATLQLAAGGVAEESILDGQIRPDLRVSGFVAGVALSPLYVEIRVQHAVDFAKADRVRDARLNMVEIDLSGLTDEQVVDPEAFAQALLLDPTNRHWIHLDSAAYLATSTGAWIFDLLSTEEFRHDVPYGKGHLTVQRQRAVLYRGEERGIPTDFELPSFVAPDGCRVDGYGNAVPYQPGLYLRNPAYEQQSDRGHHYKTYLTPLRLDKQGIQRRLI